MRPRADYFKRCVTACVVVGLFSGCAASQQATTPPARAQAPAVQIPASRPQQPVPTPAVSPAPVVPPSAPAPAPVAPKAPGQTESPKTPPRLVSFRFEEADLEVVVRTLAELAGINIVMAQGVKAKVTMWIDRVPATEAFAILQAILEANNLAVVKSGPVYKIVTLAATAQQPGPIGLGKDEASLTDEGFLTQIVPLQHLSAEEFVKVLQPLAASGKVLAYREANSVVIAGSAPTLRRLLQTIQSLDVPGAQREAQQTYVRHLENAKAGELATVLLNLFGERRGERSGPPARPEASRPLATPPPPPPRPGVAAASPADQGLPVAPVSTQEGARMLGEIRIVPDERTNALIIKATPADYRLIEEAIAKLDMMPKQVLIEVLAVEITLTDSFSFGLEWFLRTGGFALQQSFGLGPLNLVRGAALNSTGFTLTFVDNDSFRLFLNTLSGVTKLNVLTTPHVLTQNNREARIQVGQEVPIVTGSQASATGQGDQVFQTIQQRDIGRILSIRPHVNEKRQVSLDLQLELTDTLPSSTVSGTPSFSKRSVQTSVVVEDNQSLLIGGIISESHRDERTGLPWLSKIPLLGFLFRQTTEVQDKTELIMMLTPRIIANPEEGRGLTEEFRRRLDWLEQELKKLPQYRKPVLPADANANTSQQ